MALELAYQQQQQLIAVQQPFNPSPPVAQKQPAVPVPPNQPQGHQLTVSQPNQDVQPSPMVHMQSTVSVQPNPEVEKLIEQGRQDREGRNYKGALQAFNQALSLDPTNKDALSGKAFLLYYRQMNGSLLDRLRKDKEALQVYDQLLAIDPTNRDALWMKASSYAHLKRYEEALQVYDQLLALNPKNEEAFTNRIRMLYHLKSYDEIVQIDNEIPYFHRVNSMYWDSLRDMINFSRKQVEKQKRQ